MFIHSEGLTAAGLSPHGRGKQIQGGLVLVGQGSIPARAGETPPSGAHTSSVQVYPRTGGGNGGTCLAMCIARGLSPHGRGKPLSPGRRDFLQRSIPARAGETPGGVADGGVGAVYPRTGGGNSSAGMRAVTWVGLSPHGRGKRQSGPAPAQWSGSIPARAGETRWATWSVVSPEVYPRTGGGNFPFSLRQSQHRGLSPHGRGKLVCHYRHCLSPGSIPARAGETPRRGCGE